MKGSFETLSDPPQGGLLLSIGDGELQRQKAERHAGDLDDAIRERRESGADGFSMGEG